MAVSFVARKCTQCAGKLQYIKEKKIWKCLYCGAEIERQEQYDGLFTIKNVVRQSLLDTAYRRLDSAHKNLLECEKIDSRYIGTIIAKIAYDMIRVITPGACDAKDVRSVFTQLKRTHEQLKDIGSGVTDEEEALYDFLEESDIFATLVLIYDSLNDIVRCDFVAQMIDAKEIYSKPANNNLLNYAIKNGKIELADQIISNTDNIDPKIALAEILAKYPDGEAKGDRAKTILLAGGLGYEDRQLIENYLRETADSQRTKSKIAVDALKQGLAISSDLLMDKVVRDADPETVKETLSAFCEKRISDEDVIKVLSFAYECSDLQTAYNAMDCLRNSGQYVLVPAKLVIAMLSDSRLNAGDKVSRLKKTFEFKVENKAFESVLTNYLCFNSDKADDRKTVLECLLERATNIPTSTVENYVLRCSADGDNKPSIVRAIFEIGLNISFFNTLLSKYIINGADSAEVRTAIIEVLSQKGLKVDPGSFIEYICGNTDELPMKMRLIKRMIANGSQLRADTANAYLERTAANRFSPELFSMIFTAGSSFTVQAVENYLLRFKDRDAVRADNAKTIIERASGNVLNSGFKITHLGNSIVCNLLQAYTLVTNDTAATAMETADYLISAKKMKINAEMSVSGTNMKMKKYAVANKARLSEATNAVCERYNVYSMLF